MKQGIITRTAGNEYWVLLDGEEQPCVLRGRLKKERFAATSLVVIGDEVTVDEAGAITAISPRRTELSRPAFRGQPHVIAANLDQLVIVQAVAEPGVNRRLVERFIVMAERGGLAPLVVINKCDLGPEGEGWGDLGVPVLRVSAREGTGLEPLRTHLQGRRSVLAGQSGVGKSSLLNVLFPGFAARTTEISHWSGKGRHTTTSSRLYPLPGGGFLADTPGLRQLALFDDGGAELEQVFDEVAELAAACKFRDCSHTHEPGCAVKAAVASGEVDEGRYRHYVRLKTRRK